MQLFALFSLGYHHGEEEKQREQLWAQVFRASAEECEQRCLLGATSEVEKSPPDLGIGFWC